MKSWEVEEMIKKEAYDAGVKDGYDSGYDSGVEVVDRLNILLSEAGRSDDIIKAARDKEYQKKLLEEFHLVTE